MSAWECGFITDDRGGNGSASSSECAEVDSSSFSKSLPPEVGDDRHSSSESSGIGGGNSYKEIVSVTAMVR